MSINLHFSESKSVMYSWINCHLPMCRRHGQPSPPDPHAEVFLAFGRVFSGVAREGATVQVQFAGATLRSVPRRFLSDATRTCCCSLVHLCSLEVSRSNEALWCRCCRRRTRRRSRISGDRRRRSRGCTS